MPKYVPPHLRNGGTSSNDSMPSSSLQTAARQSSSSRFPSTRSESWNARNSSSYEQPPPVRHSNSGRFGRTQQRVAFFGDSFIRLFGLLNEHSKEGKVIQLRAFKGASATGIGREGNENRDVIQRTVQPGRFDRVVFCFGSVDVHLSYYFKKYIKLDTDFDLDEIAKKYVEFVASLNQPGCLIVGVYGSALDDKDVIPSLINYGSLGWAEEGQERPTVHVDPDDTTLHVRQNRVFTFNASIAKYCADNPNIEFIDANEEILDASTLKMKDAYRDVSDHNIHVVWETTLMLWLKKLPWLQELAPKGLAGSLKETLAAYLETKPWAERGKDAKPLQELLGMDESHAEHGSESK